MVKLPVKVNDILTSQSTIQVNSCLSFYLITMLICMLFLLLTPPLYLYVLTHILLHSLSLYIYLYNFVNFLPSTLNLRMIKQQSKCCLVLPVILTAKNVSRKRKSHHTFLGLAWGICDLLMKYEEF